MKNSDWALTFVIGLHTVAIGAAVESLWSRGSEHDRIIVDMLRMEDSVNYISKKVTEIAAVQGSAERTQPYDPARLVFGLRELIEMIPELRELLREERLRREHESDG